MVDPLMSLAAAAARLLPAGIKRALYRLGPVTRGLRGALNRAAPTGLTPTIVAAGGLAGATLLLDLQTEKDYWLGTYEPELQQAIADWVKPDTVVYDLGANIGYVSLLLARALGPGGKVFAFEPLPANQNRFAQNIEISGRSNVTLVPQAVSDKKGEVSFQIHASDDMGKISTESSNSIRVQATSLDEFVTAGHPQPNLIKIDIEGGEIAALRGMSKILASVRPLFFIELHGRDVAESARTMLTQANYVLRHMTRGYPPVGEAALPKKVYIVAVPA